MEILKTDYVIEKVIKIEYLDEEDFSGQIKLRDDEYDHFKSNNTLYFIERIKGCERGYRENFHELSEYVAAHSDAGTWNSWSTEEAKEFMSEMEGCSDMIYRYKVVLKAMEVEHGDCKQ